MVCATFHGQQLTSRWGSVKNTLGNPNTATGSVLILPVKCHEFAFRWAAGGMRPSQTVVATWGVGLLEGRNRSSHGLWALHFYGSVSVF